MSDITALFAEFQDQLAKMRSGMAGDRIKGNRPKQTEGGTDGEHFPPESIIVDGGALVNEKKVWVSFKFEEDGVEHVVKATMDVDKAGKPGGDDVIMYDGLDTEADDEVQGVRTGLEGLRLYARGIFEFKFELDGEKQHIRFDVG